MVKKTKAKKRVKEILTDAVVAVGDPASSQAYNEEHVEGLDDNSFEPLASANVVKFSGSREIEAIDQDAIKVRLSRYQVSLIPFQHFTMLTSTEMLRPWGS